ncbi:MAG: hypothetical protein CMP10_19690 [Zetaproteobacteria bacterium]|nr:hypothetical protein [Pseudobdellovibrionaceae bacterium]|tara:strand:+ start:16 stop:468 length:453 start_codon:yes stop_codon:yes gene_type:complete
MSNPVDELAKYNVRPEAKKITTEVVVGDILESSVSPLTSSMDVYEATTLLTKKGLTGLAVVDDDRNIIGFYSTRSSLKLIYNEVYNRWPRSIVRDHMIEDTHEVDIKTSLNDLIERYINAYFHTYPVTENGKYVGYVVLERVIKHLLKNK